MTYTHETTMSALVSNVLGVALLVLGALPMIALATAERPALLTAQETPLEASEPRGASSKAGRPLPGVRPFSHFEASISPLALPLRRASFSPPRCSPAFPKTPRPPAPGPSSRRAPCWAACSSCGCDEADRARAAELIAAGKADEAVGAVRSR